MITKASQQEIDQYKSYAYRLSQDFRTSGFPTYLDEIKTEEEFYQLIEDRKDDEDGEILLYRKNGTVKGWIHYYWLEEDYYLSFYTFNIEEDYGEAIDEFLEYINDRFSDFDIFFGFPEENLEATAHLAAIGFDRTEESDVYILHFSDYQLREDDENIVEVNDDNWEDFASLHARCDDIYWNNRRLYKAIHEGYRNPWKLFLLYENGEAIGNVYFTYVGDFMEIFGIDFKDDVFNENTMTRLLIKALNQSCLDKEKDMTYFAEVRERAVVENAGLKYICRYVLYEQRKDRTAA